MTDEIVKMYGKRLRVRVCGLLYDGERLLLINHRLSKEHDWWAPPGGAVEFGEPLEAALMRELREEAGLEITVAQFAFGCEFIRDPLHAIELFFWANAAGGTLRVGQDPELKLITDAKFIHAESIGALPQAHRHGIFNLARTQHEFQQLKGFYRI